MVGFNQMEIAKHLSEVVKKVSGQSANDWINEHVLLESKALLKSTTMTVQQISGKKSATSDKIIFISRKQIKNL